MDIFFFIVDLTCGHTRDRVTYSYVYDSFKHQHIFEITMWITILESSFSTLVVTCL